MTNPAEIKQLKRRFIKDMYSIARGRFGVLVDTYDIAEHSGLNHDMLTMVVEYWEEKGVIATYEGTLYASLTLKGVESIESRTCQNEETPI